MLKGTSNLIQTDLCGLCLSAWSLKKAWSTLLILCRDDDDDDVDVDDDDDDFASSGDVRVT